MPNLPMHIHLAHEIAQRLDRGYLYDNLGCFYLGSTAPDIRAMTKWPREHTHFAPLSAEEVGTGARTMFRRYPGLFDEAGESPATRSFLLGYISHLAADETWITSVYRANFDTSVEATRLTGDQVQADIWDRAAQLEMDRVTLPELQGELNAQAAVSCGDYGVSVAFLEDGLITEWKDWVSRFVSWEFSWERLKRSLNRMYRDDAAVQNTVEQFLERMPGSLEELYARIPEAKVSAYRRRAVDATLTQVREFLPE